MNDDTPRDVYLQAALRHAPDDDQGPPAHLRAQVLAAAQRAASERLTPARPRPRSGFGWGAGASGAVASVLLAGVIGLLWQGAPPGPAVEGGQDLSAPQRAEAPPPVPAAAPPVQPQVERQLPAAPRAARRPPVPDLPPLAPGLPAPEFAAVPQVPQVQPIPPAPAPAPAPAPTLSSMPPRAAAESRAAPAPAPALDQALGAARSLSKLAAPPPRWRLDDGAPGAASPAWLARALAADQSQGRPSTLKELPGARRIELMPPGGGVQRLWLSSSQLLWCRGESDTCSLSNLDADVAQALLDELPPPRQAEKRDSR